VANQANNILYVFPGQGSQYPGMGSDLCRDFAVARTVYDRASEVLGYDIAELSFHDPDQQLNLTRHTQPALLTHSIASCEVFRELAGDRLKPAMAAGHSLGEYSALVATNALTFEDALLLVKKRGELMGSLGEGEMSAFPMPVDDVRSIAERHHCAVAGCNLPQQTVIGGRAEDLELVEQEVTEQFPRKRPVRLKTEGAFHTYYMVAAAQQFRPVLSATGFEPSEVPVLSNFTGGFHDPDVELMRSRLFFQLFHPVMWHANLMTALDAGIDMIIEFGGGIGKGTGPDEKRPNLEGMIKKALRGTDYEVEYRAAINSPTVSSAAA
jgi:[acyl-carrier-protein] S-malonyltransferase